VLHRIIDTYPVVRVEDEGALQEVLGLSREVFEDMPEGLFGLVAEGFQVFYGFLVGDEAVVFLFGGADYLEDFVAELGIKVTVGPSWSVESR
jgi:hypothetical protein